MNRIAITGSTGLVGKELAKHFIQQGKSVVCIARDVTKVHADAEKFQVQGIDGDTNYGDCLKEVDCVIHCAAHCHQTGADADLSEETFTRINTDGTINLAKQALQAGVKRFVFVSTIKVFGEGNPVDKPYSLNDTPMPEDAYGVSKLTAEKALKEMCNEAEMDWVTIRCPLIYGPGVKANFLSLINIVKKRIPLPFGSVKNRRSMLYLGNLVHLIETCMQAEAASNQIFLASDDDDVSTGQMIRHIAKGLGIKPVLLPVSAGLLSGMLGLLGKRHVADRVLGSLSMDISETKRILQWTPPYSIEEGIAVTLKEFKK